MRLQVPSADAAPDESAALVFVSQWFPASGTKSIRHELTNGRILVGRHAFECTSLICR
jgi:hypothetical protein